jgi:hypothetical protein
MYLYLFLGTTPVIDRAFGGSEVSQFERRPIAADVGCRRPSPEPPAWTLRLTARLRRRHRPSNVRMLPGQHSIRASDTTTYSLKMTDGAYRAALLVVVTGTVVFGAVVAASASAEGISDTGTGTESGAAPASLLEDAAPVSGYDGIAVRIRIYPNGTARWQVDYRYRLADAAADRAFERVSRNVTAGPFTELFASSALPRAEAQTDREMGIEADGVTTNRSYPAGRYGVVSYRFRWTNFAARRSGDRLVVGDALGGYRLGANDTLSVEWTGRLRKTSVTPAPVEERRRFVEWTGPMQFRTVGPRLELELANSGSIGLPLLPLAAVVALAVVGAGWYGRSRRAIEGDEQGSDRGEAAGTGEDEGEVTGSEPAEELLTDEERVLQLLEDRGGRMKQQDLLDEVEWSRTKASDVVNEMHEAERIEVYRLGRENVLTLPGEIEI